MSIFKKKHTQSYDKINKKPVLKTSICTGEQVAGFQDIHTGRIEEIMLIKNATDVDRFKQMYGIEEEIPKVY
ncbi:MAG: aspartate dehydrogenase [Lachnospira sp.]|nr:aspartate dehydrogenase [Lachnospira sp.]